MSLEQQGSAAFAVMLLAVPLTSLASVTMAYANFNGSYFVPALGTCVLNVAVIVGLLLGGITGEPLLVLGGSIMLGALMRWGMQLSRAHAAGDSAAAVAQISFIDAGSSGTRPLLVQYVNALIASSLLLLLPVIARSIASSVGSGYLALFNYAQKLADLPTGVIVTAIATMLLPHLSRLLVHESDRPAARQAFYLSLRFSVTASVAMIIPAIAFSRPIVALLFGGRALGDAELDIVADLMCVGFIGFPFQAIIAILMLSFSSLKDNLTPAIVCLFGVVVLLIAAMPLLRYGGILGIAAALVISQAAVAGTLAIGLNRKSGLNLLGAFSDVTFLRALALGGLALLILCLLGRGFAGASTFIQVVFAIMSGGGALLFMLCLDTNYRNKFSGLKGTKA